MDAHAHQGGRRVVDDRIPRAFEGANGPETRQAGALHVQMPTLRRSDAE
jgi:hypothetical protein